MHKQFFIFLQAIILLNIILSQKILKIPFKFYSSSQLFPNQFHPVTNKFMSQLLIEISIGTPPQKLNCSLNLNTFYSFFLSHEIPDITLPSYFNKSNSNTYNCTEKQSYYWKEDFDMAETFNDNIQIFSLDNKNIINNIFTFLLIDGLGYDVPNEFYAPGIIGLRLKRENNMKQINENRFIYQIKKYGLIDSEIFYFDFNENDENGYFIIGENIFDNDNYKRINVGNLLMPELGPEWSFNFDNIYYGNKEIIDSKDCLIKSELGLIVGSTYYENIIKDFFKNESECILNNTKMGYATFKYYSCEEKFDENKMDDLIFVLKPINYNFTFKGKDLFYIENKKKYFKILFLFYENHYWYFGREFLKKYKLRFDTDGKSFYIPLKIKNNKDSLFKKTYFWIIVSLSIFVIVLIIFILFYLKKYPRKKRANELNDDDYDYIQKDYNINENEK